MPKKKNLRNERGICFFVTCLRAGLKARRFLLDLKNNFLFYQLCLLTSYLQIAVILVFLFKAVCLLPYYLTETKKLRLISSPPIHQSMSNQQGQAY